MSADRTPDERGVLSFPAGPVPRGSTMPYTMRGAEIPTSLVLGEDDTIEPLEPVATGASELAAVLERTLLPALERPPCLVAFSGGRDSSGILAAAIGAARRHGLALPIPVTNFFPGVRDVDESAWQEAVIKHLGIDDWVRVEIDDELDLVGPIAAPLLRRYGVLWPPNTHFVIPLAAHARGGTLLTGLGGDELFIPSSPRGARVLAREVKPRVGDIRAVVSVLTPHALRARRLRGRLDRLPWLIAEAAEACVNALAGVLTEETFRWGRSVLNQWWRARQRLAMVQSLSAAAGDDVVVGHPYMNPEFLRAVAGARRRTGFPSRDMAMKLIFGDLLPDAVLTRGDKAAFFEPFVNRHSRAFVSSWDGTGVDARLVDVDALRCTWNAPTVDARSYALLQSAWLASSQTSDDHENVSGEARRGSRSVTDRHVAFD